MATVANQNTPVQGNKTRPILDPGDTIALYGDTGDGKTAQIGELAERYYADSKQITRLYSPDRGGWLTIRPYVNLGIIDVIPMFGNPWIWIEHAVKGEVPDKDGRWIVPPDRDRVGLHAFDGATSIADELMRWMREEVANGKNFGEDGVKFQVTVPGETVKIGGSGRTHYKIVQERVTEKCWQSQSLNTPVLWTFAARRAADEDPNTTGQVLGPQVAGKALTAEIPRWFKYTFHILAEPQLNAAPKHILYLEDHQSQNAGMSKGLGNARNPLAGAQEAPVPWYIEPASIVKALELLKKRQDTAEDVIAKRLGIVRK